MATEGSFWHQLSSDEGEGFRIEPDKVRKVELRYERRGEAHEGVRVTIVSARGHIKVLKAPRVVLASVVEKLYESQSEEGLRE